uniref:Astacin domain-containing protein n=1 Tax=Parastrongyloides trichosuri TaxID=131310 RepID=A0A0N4ZGK5_PARTI
MDYNYGSINHFGMKDYNINGNDTFSTKMFNELYRHMIGQKYETSFNDYKVLNRIYCKDKMKECKKECKNYGYPDPKNCKCRCPNGFVGDLCQNIEGVEKWHGIVYGTCGPVKLRAEIAFQHYRIKKEYNCFIQVESTNPHRLVLLYNIYYFSYRGTPCVPGWEIEIRYRKDKGAMGLCLCGKNNVPFWMISEDTTVFIHFVGIYSWHYLAFYYRQYTNGTNVEEYLVTN